MTRLTERRLNRATLARQLLLRRERVPAVEAVRRVFALQAQEPASPYLGLWNRVDGFDAVELDQAFAGRAVIKATLLRITLHAVHADDYPAVHLAMQPTLRAARLGDRRYRATGLSSADADALIPDVAAFASRPRSNADVDAWLDDRLGPLPKPGVWWALRQYGPFVHAPTGGPWSFGPRPAYIAAPDRDAACTDPRAALRYLVRRYLESFGPATVADIAQFGLLSRPAVREAVEALGDALVRRDGPGGAPLHDIPDAPLPPEDAPAPPRLLPMWDSILLAYADRSRVVPPDYRRVIARSNGDTLPTLLVDGRVVGVWRPLDGGIEATAFERLPSDAWEALDTEARALLAFLGSRDPDVYRRYGRWWASLPRAEVRILGRLRG